MEKLVKFYAFRKENNTYACVGITEKAAETKTLMAKLKKRYPVEITENEYNEMRKGNFSILSSSEYDEREEKQKKPVKKIIDEKLIKSFLPNRKKRIILTFDENENKAYVTDFYTFYIGNLNEVKTVFENKIGYKLNKKESTFQFDYSCFETPTNINAKKLYNQLIERYENIKAYECIEIFNPNYDINDKNEENVNHFSSFYHVKNNFILTEKIKPFSKCDIDFSIGYCGKWKESNDKNAIIFFKNSKNEIAYICFPIFMKDSFKDLPETKEVITETLQEKTMPAEPKKEPVKEIKKLYCLSKEETEKALETFDNVYSFIYDMPYHEKDERYHQTVVKADDLLCDHDHEFHKFVNFLAEKREDLFSSDRELYSVYAAFIEFKNDKKDSYILEILENSKKYNQFKDDAKKSMNETQAERDELTKQIIEKIDEKIDCEKVEENHKEIEVPKKSETENNLKIKEPKEVEEKEMKEEQKEPKKSLSVISVTASTSSQESKKEPVIIPNIQKNKDLTFLETLKESDNSDLSAAYIGTSIEDKEPVYIDFKKSIHLMIAGATGSGKSVMMNAIISSLMFKNTIDTAQFLLIDPKRVEFFDYSNSNMLYGGKVYENVSEGITALENVMYEMNDRYIQLKYMHARSIDDLPLGSKMPRIYIFIDELSFCMLEDRKKMENIISKIGMLGRAAGIHLILATQHPDRKVITGSIQANIPTVIGLATRKAVDSRMITGSNACTKLKGCGDAVLIDGLKEVHFQGAYISSDDIQRIVNGNIGNESITALNAPYIPNRLKESVSQFKS